MLMMDFTCSREQQAASQEIPPFISHLWAGTASAVSQSIIQNTCIMIDLLMTTVGDVFKNLNVAMNSTRYSRIHRALVFAGIFRIASLSNLWQSRRGHLDKWSTNNLELI
jgi:uncharacterized hydantoinase/oxoprolinase family protein